MLRNTFIHFNRIGTLTEFKLWRDGVLNWDDLAHTNFAHLGNIEESIESSIKAFEEANLDFFSHALPPSDKWRTYVDFADDFICLDIETTGLSIYDRITLVGIESKGDYFPFLAESNLEEAIHLLENSKGIITFNGKLFDLPFVKRRFPNIKLPDMHLDLRFLGRRVGLKGSLKHIENTLGISRTATKHEYTGADATVLWCKHENGDKFSLEELIKYNAMDTLNLRLLANIIVNKLINKLNKDIEKTSKEGKALLFQPKTLRFNKIKTPIIKMPLIAVNSSISIDKRIVKFPKNDTKGKYYDLEYLSNSITCDNFRIVGIDLTGSESRPSGWAILDNTQVVSGLLSTDEDIVRMTVDSNPDIVAIDSPLSLPEGRINISDDSPCRKHGISRHCERVLKRRGISVYWCLIQSMQALTKRGIRIAEALRKKGLHVIEVYPGAAQDIMGIPRKGTSLEFLRQGLISFGIEGIVESSTISHDELDAITSAIVGVFYLSGYYEALGNEAEDYLIIPDITKPNKPFKYKPKVFNTSDNKIVFFSGPDLDAVKDSLSKVFGSKTIISASEVNSPKKPIEYYMSYNENVYRQLLIKFGAIAKFVLFSDSFHKTRAKFQFFDRFINPDNKEWIKSLNSFLTLIDPKGVI